LWRVGVSRIIGLLAPAWQLRSPCHAAATLSDPGSESVISAGTVTLVSETHVPDVVYDQVRQHFSETELANMTLRIAAINAWNRIAISFRAVHPIHWKGAA
jgi:alkylhydroperoxidase family enzyme